MNKNNQGKISNVPQPDEEKLKKWFGNGTCWHFWEQADKIGIGQKKLPAESIGKFQQYGRIFNQRYELRWEDDRFWLAQEADDGVFKTKNSEIFLRAEQGEEYKKVKVVHYYQHGLVVYTRFKEAIK